MCPLQQQADKGLSILHMLIVFITSAAIHVGYGKHIACWVAALFPEVPI